MERWWGNDRKRAREGGDEGREDLARGENKKNKKSKKNKKRPNSPPPPPPQITNNLVDDVEELKDMDKLEHGSCCFDDDDLSNTTCTRSSTTAYERMFDFPWLKEGMNSFKSEDYCQQLQLEDSFSSFNSNLLEASTSSNHSAAPELFPEPQPNLCDSLLPHHHKLIEEQAEEEEEDEEENDLLTFKADELEGTDWIWSSPLLDDHQPPPQLAANGFNKVA